MQKFIQRFPFSSFYTITFIFSFILLIAHFVFQSVGKYSVSFTQLAPTLSVLTVSIILKDSTILKDIFKHFLISQVFSKWFILAILLPFIIIIISSSILSYLKINFVFWDGNMYFYIINVIAILIGSIAEEIGWRGYLLPKLQNVSNPFYSSIIVGLLWGIWHLNFTGGIIGFILYTLTIIEMSVCMTWLYNRTEGNLWLMTAWHLSFNISSHIFLWQRFNVNLFFVESIVFGVLNVILVLSDRKIFFKKFMTQT